MTKGKHKAKAAFTIVCDSGDEADTSIPQARTVWISENGLRILQTPRSPQKRSTTYQFLRVESKRRLRQYWLEWW